LNKVKSQYAYKFGHSTDEEVVEKDGIKLSFTCRAPPSMAAQESLNEVKSRYACKLGYSIDRMLSRRMAWRYLSKG